MRYEVPFSIKVANMTTSIGLADPDGLGFATANMRHEVLAKAPNERKADIESHWMEFVGTIEERLNTDIAPNQLSRMALAQLQEHRSSIEMYKGSREQEIADPNAEQHHKEYAEKLRQQYVAELSNTDTLIRAFKDNDSRATAKFGITVRGYGSYTVRLKISFQQPGPWGNIEDNDTEESKE